ncbi:MAG: nitrilase-related carbon-nitrogen hydrolase [Acidobacteriota bacterium]
MRHSKWFLFLLGIGVSVCAAEAKTVRVCAGQTAISIRWRLSAAEALREVDRALGELEQVVRRAGRDGCDVLALPEDTLGLLRWEAAHKPEIYGVLSQAVPKMLDRLGREAAAHNMYLICSSDTAEPDGTYRNTAFFLGRNGREIGRYYKVQTTVAESDRRRGTDFPVFETPDLGGVGILICYDMVMPEAARVLALKGADIVFLVTMGGAVTTGDEDLERAAFRTRAADNYLYFVVARRRGGGMILSPQGRFLAEGLEANSIARADIDPFAGREGGDALNSQTDMRARLFRERNPAAYAVLSDPNPPVLRKIPATITVEDAVRIGGGALTIGEERFGQAEELARAGRTADAIRAFEKLRQDYPKTWIDRVARERLAKLGAADSR